MANTSNKALWHIFSSVKQVSDLVQLQLVYQTPFLIPYAQTLEHSTYQPRFLAMAIDLGNCFPTHQYAQPKKYKEFIHTVARLCPPIVRIAVGLKALSSSFYRNLLDLHQQGYLQQLQSLSDFSYPEAHVSEMNYYCLAVAMKASLTRVSIAKNPSSKLFGDHQSEMNMREHLKAFPRLKQLDASYKGEGFLYGADVFIAKCIAPTVSIHAYLTDFGDFRLLPFDLNTVKRQP
ncbi:D-lactate ferricytochrome c oxidoreductase [Mucor velutinosus]|uniref:D-lactate ferricytochrome c oxidoreductase n=1 Tax=Mucor velutinosus TaxID=708070 RepID=A0AAN7DLB2_9FUNG|nr:D-lactate ferricytochrome c oxidoreductase [Mucor velutinosus]